MGISILDHKVSIVGGLSPSPHFVWSIDKDGFCFLFLFFFVFVLFFVLFFCFFFFNFF